ncbi:TraR/DksA C4-type zinc finger protein [Domibacillus sp. A3M-37]|uniref:TraR/DksA C4-type zinc finger protein n=1 Tax=Domibacillus TaxID=1433999 RepID=UPI0006978131|nr:MULTISPECIES: TraR/DksA C4-type zinc finger protein [Domibacillus]MCP3762408.1 TraR/DksA C4-type zinc finger protein [Domibacillus sp. A3M-37]
MLTKEQLIELKQELLRQKQQLTEQLEQDEENQDVGDLSSYANHPADTGTELYERERDKALDEHRRVELEKIDAALAAMKEGTYGICKKSGEEIPFERLQAVPTTLYSVENSPDQTPETDRVPEDRISHPDDGIDSFSDAANDGTSETPSDFSEDKENYNELYKEEEDEKNPAT